MSEEKMVPKRLKEARLHRGLKQVELAELLELDGVDIRKMISNYETGRYTPSFKIVVAIAKKLNYPECYFYIQDDIFAKKVLSLFLSNAAIENLYHLEIQHIKDSVCSLSDFLKKNFP
ncbi:helix-turn-helix transcriptional regulator [Photorhabdus australis]|nr:helix-turn-helix transcriptional regulator [Photorhabdus australis]